MDKDRFAGAVEKADGAVTKAAGQVAERTDALRR